MADFTRLHQIIEHWVNETPNKLAAIDHDGRRLNFADLAVEVDNAEDILRSAGIRAGDRALLVAENSLVMVAMILACSRLDAWAVPINARLTEAELGHIRQHANPRAIVFTTAASEAATTHAERLGANQQNDIAVLGNLDTSAAAPAFKAANQQAAILIYTSGTMSAPKGVMISHANTLHNIAVNIDIRGLSVEDHVYAAPPHTHIFALTVTLASLAAGATVTFLPHFDPATVFAALANGVSVLPAVPAMYNKLLDYAERNAMTAPVAPKLRYISAGGAPLDLGWKHRVERFFNLPLQNGYGMTEATPIITSTRFHQHRDDVSVGEAVAGVEIKIAPLPDIADGIGEIFCRGPNVMLGYYRNPDETAATVDAEGFLHTGDLGRLDADGSLTVIGRLREVINRSGFNVYPGEVETALNQHPAVHQCAVVGRARDDGDEDILAFVECLADSEADTAQLQAHLKQRLSPYKCPNHILIVDQLPAAASGKLLKIRMLDSFAERIAELDRPA